MNKKLNTKDEIWSTWSMQSHTVDEIREMYLTHANEICSIYVCEFSKIPEDFLLEFAALSTCLVDKKNKGINLKVIMNVLKRRLFDGDKSVEHERVNIVKDGELQEVSCKSIQDRINWGEISAHNLYSEETYIKLSKYIVWNRIVPCGWLTVDKLKELRQKYDKFGAESVRKRNKRLKDDLDDTIEESVDKDLVDDDFLFDD